MKLLFDANLSPRLAAEVGRLFPESEHVFNCHLEDRGDLAIWKSARSRGFAIVSKDGDFHQMSVLYGAPPKVIWIRTGNASTKQILSLLVERRRWIEEFDVDEVATFLVL